MRPSMVHPSHVLMSSSGLLWCSACGAWATKTPKILKAECARKSLGDKRLLRQDGRVSLAKLEKGWSPCPFRKSWVGEGLPVKFDGKVQWDSLVPATDKVPVWAFGLLDEF